MLYYLFDYLNTEFNFPGAGVFQYISFRAGMAAITSLTITMIFGRTLIDYLRKKQAGESIRDLGLDGQMEKSGTPTMGGLIIIGAIVIPALLFTKLDNIYIILMLFTTIWLGFIGFVDDYIKIFKKKKEGLAGRFKIIGQIILGIVIGLTMFFHPDVVIREQLPVSIIKNATSAQGSDETFNVVTEKVNAKPIHSTQTTIPFFKNNNFDYASVIAWLGGESKKWAWIIFIPMVILIITAVSNGANLTDGIDGLATGSSAIIGSTLGLLAWISGNVIFSNYLNIMYIPNVGELTIFISAFVGATIGFLWYNTYPAQVFMGDTGSLTIGGIIAVFAIIIRKELLIPILAGIFLMENISVVLQVAYFKYTKKKRGKGKRVFLMAPLHHHYQKKGYAEPKIVMRFFIIGLLLAMVSIITLKLR